MSARTWQVGTSCTIWVVQTIFCACSNPGNMHKTGLGELWVHSECALRLQSVRCYHNNTEIETGYLRTVHC